MVLFEGNEGKANFFLRIGMALTLLWSVKTKFGAPEQVAGLFDSLGLSFLASPGIVTFIGIVLVIVSAMLIFGWQVRWAGAFLTIYFAVSLVTGIFAGDAAFSVGPAIWKDFALLGGAIALMLGGAGDHAIGE